MDQQFGVAMIEFLVDIEPIPKARPRMTRYGHAYTPQRTKDFESDFRDLAESYRPEERFTGPLVVEIIFYLKRPKKPKHEAPIVRPDLDNFIKGVIDSLNPNEKEDYEGFWDDDSQIVKIIAKKQYAFKKPGIWMQIKSHGGE